MHELLSAHAEWTAWESQTPKVRPSACCPCEVASTWSSCSFCFSRGPLEQDPSRECNGWVSSYPQHPTCTPTTYALRAQTLRVRKISPSFVPKVSCKHFLVIEETNHPSVDTQWWMYSVCKQK
jgi:hypothetical protein